MAEKLERTYVIPLRKEFSKAPKYKRAKKAINAIKEFTAKHMKSKDVRIGKYLNEKVWQHGIKNPPTKVEVKAVKEGDTVVVELVGAPEPKKEEKKKETKKPAKEKAKEEVEEELEKELKPKLGKKTAEKVAEEVVEQSEKEITKDIPKKKVPKASGLKEKKKTNSKK